MSVDVTTPAHVTRVLSGGAVVTDAKLIAEPPLLVLPSLAVEVGLNEAIVLQQIHFETRHSELAWWPTEAAELRRKFPFWSSSTIKRTLASVQRAGLVKVRQEGMDRTKRYRVQIDTVHQLKLTPNRSNASAQSEPVPISLKQKRGNGREGKSARARVEDSFLR